MSWNYRVLFRQDKSGEQYFAVHEVYYDADGKPTSWTCDAARPIGDNLLELAVDAARMAAACGCPVLVVADDDTLHQYPDCDCERCKAKQQPKRRTDEARDPRGSSQGKSAESPK